jgi:hypothetical protein
MPARTCGCVGMPVGLSSPRMARSLAVLRPPPKEAVASPRMIASRLLMMLGSVALPLLELPPEPEPEDVPDEGGGDTPGEIEALGEGDGVVVVVEVVDVGSVVVVLVGGNVVVVVVDGVVVVVLVGGSVVVVVLVGGEVVVVVELVTWAKPGLASIAMCTVPVARTRKSTLARAPCPPSPLLSVRCLQCVRLISFSPSPGHTRTQVCNPAVTAGRESMPDTSPWPVPDARQPPLNCGRIRDCRTSILAG